MAEIVGGIGISHIPTIGAVMDAGRTEEVPFKDVFAAYERVRGWVRELKPDTVVVVYNDHGAAFSLDLVPTFVVGTGPEYLPADEGRGRRAVPSFVGDVDLAWHVVDQVIPNGFDLTVGQEFGLDHGFTVPMSAVFGTGLTQWPVEVIPVAVNVVQQPTPTAQRCFELGRSIRAAVESFDGDRRVLVIGTGGMSHQLQGQRAGHINQDFDRSFLSDIAAAPEKLTALSNAELIRLAGTEGAELIMWMVMRGALGESATTSFSHYHVPVSNTAAGVITIDPR
jgi:protocatechuate 4,5-dioxygenase, beta chain